LRVNIHFMKTRLISGAFLVALFFSLPTSYAAPLIYGGTLTPVPVGTGPAVGASLLFSTGPQAFTAPDYSGNLFSSVYVNDTSNPYGLGDLTFTYLIQMGAGTTDPLESFSISSFSSYLTDVSYTTASLSDIVPTSVNRSASGSVINFSYGVAAPLGAGTTSALMVIYTDATSFAPTYAGFNDGVGTFGNSVAPAQLSSVPEPGSPALLGGFGLIGLLFFQHRRKSQTQAASHLSSK